MGERGGSRSWREFIDDLEPGKVKVPKNAGSSEKRSLPGPGEGKKNTQIPVPEIVREQIKRDQLLSIVLKGDPMQKKSGESEEDFADRQRLYLEGRLQQEQDESGEAFKARRDLARKYRQYVAAVTKLSAILKIDLKRPKVVDLLRADYRKQLIRDVFEADRPTNQNSAETKERTRRIALRRLRDLFGITDMKDIFDIADLDAMSDLGTEDDGQSVWDLPPDADSDSDTDTDVKEVRDPHDISLINMALRGNPIAQATLEDEFGIAGAQELLNKYR